MRASFNANQENPEKEKSPDNAVRGNVRLAVEADLPLIEKWLPKEGDIDTLASSWQIAKEVFSEGNLYVWESVESDLPLAYCRRTLNSHNSVLEVHPRYRGRGIGREIVALMLEASVKSRNGERIYDDLAICDRAAYSHKSSHVFSPQSSQ